MTDQVTISRELLPCPFCGSPANSGDGFSPCESVTYIWCSNHLCELHLIDNCGFTPETWNTRAALAAPAQDGWIPVSERLPNILQEVIVYSSFDGVTAGMLDGYEDWYSPNSEYKLVRVTHWQPLPPKQKESK